MGGSGKSTALGTSLGGTSLGGTSLGGKLNFANPTAKKGEEKELTSKPEQKEPQSSTPTTTTTTPTTTLTSKKNISNITQQAQKIAGQTSYVIKAHRDSDLEHVSSDEEEDEKVFRPFFLLKDFISSVRIIRMGDIAL